MITTLLPQKTVDHIRSVKNTLFVLYTLFLIDALHPGRSTRLGELSAITEADVRTLQKQLDALCASNRAIFDGRGYVLTEIGRALLLSNPTILDINSEVQALALSPAPSAGTSEAQALRLIPASHVLGELHNMGGASTTHTARALEVVVEESLLNLKDLDSPSTTEGAQNVQPDPKSGLNTAGQRALTRPALERQRFGVGEEEISVAQILAGTPILFGDPGVLSKRLNLSAIDASVALGWVAQAYDQRRGLQRPAGLIYSRLADIERPTPQAKYIQQPESYLPDEYLETLGMVEYRCDDCSAKFGKKSELNAHIEQAHPAPEPVVEETWSEPDETVTMRTEGHLLNAVQAWQMVLEQLKMEMSKTSFDAWVRDTRPVHYEANDLNVGARNAYARDWLEGRMTSTVVRMLAGILNTEISVRFCVEAEHDE